MLSVRKNDTERHRKALKRGIIFSAREKNALLNPHVELLLFFILFLLFPLIAAAAEPLLIEGSIAPEMDLKELFLTVNSPDAASVDQEAIFALDGVVSAREILQPSEAGFIGLLELTIGEWQGLESVTAYRCYIQLEGERFSALIPEGRQRNPDPREIPLNASVIAFGRYIGYSEDADGARYPVLLGEAVRVLK